jgi:iron(III) transport system ATP-binding protein
VLLDEPFSNLDVEVRLRLRAELPGVLARCGASGVIVTHDPEEALAICDRVAVLESGHLHQCASPQDLVAAPATAFVGRFVLQSNLLPARWQGSTLTTAFGALEAPAGVQLPAPSETEDLQVLVSPQGILLTPDDNAEAWVLGREFLGREWLYQVQCGQGRLRLRLPLEHDYNRGQRCRLRLRAGEPVRLFPAGVDLVAAAATAHL